MFVFESSLLSWWDLQFHLSSFLAWLFSSSMPLPRWPIMDMMLPATMTSMIDYLGGILLFYSSSLLFLYQQSNMSANRLPASVRHTSPVRMSSTPITSAGYRIPILLRLIASCRNIPIRKRNISSTSISMFRSFSSFKPSCSTHRRSSGHRWIRKVATIWAC